MVCPLCGQRKARRTCPALTKQICAVCCGTKRLVEIQCPADCVYLSAARDHPPAAAVRRQQHDLGWLMQFMRDLNERQSDIFFLVNAFLVRYEPPEFRLAIDDDVAEAVGALAATLETSSRGVIYEHRPASIPAGRLMTALTPLIAEAGRSGGTAFERDAAVVLRRIEDAARTLRQHEGGQERAFLDLIGRVIGKVDERAESAGGGSEPKRLIVP